MQHQITIREAVADADIARFWEQLYRYYARDIFTEAGSGEREHFIGPEYYEHMMKIRSRPQDRAYFLFFVRDGQEIGFAMPVIFTSEDGKCFLMEYCVYPEYRGNGTGRACAGNLLDWARARGARYAELNYGGDARRKRFWESVGFVPNGIDEWGDPLMLLPPEDPVPITVERLTNPEDWQLRKLENGFRAEIGEAPLPKTQQEALARAIRDGRITFFLAKRGYRAVGLCSVARCFSTFACSDTGVFDDFYIEPVFRKAGIARQLAHAAQTFAVHQDLASLTVTCAPCDEAMYQALGFGARLGTAFATVIED